MEMRIMGRIAEAVKMELGAEYEVRLHKVRKNNGCVKNGVLIMRPSVKTCPVIYIDRLLEMVSNGECGVLDAAHEIVNMYRSECIGKFIGFDNVLSKEYILGHVVYQIVGTKKNAFRIAEMPHKEVLDLSAVYQVEAYHDGEGFHISVMNTMMDLYDITMKELDEAAKQNTEKKGFFVTAMADVLGMEEVPGMPRMFVLTNQDRMNGSAILLYEKYICDLAKQVGDDLYILPSSIHELIALPVSGLSPSELAETVMEVNASEVADDEVLSGSVYRYSLSARSFGIARAETDWA